MLPHLTEFRVVKKTRIVLCRWKSLCSCRCTASHLHPNAEFAHPVSLTGDALTPLGTPNARLTPTDHFKHNNLHMHATHSHRCVPQPGTPRHPPVQSHVKRYVQPLNFHSENWHAYVCSLSHSHSDPCNIHKFTQMQTPASYTRTRSETNPNACVIPHTHTHTWTYTPRHTGPQRRNTCTHCAFTIAHG